MATIKKMSKKMRIINGAVPLVMLDMLIAFVIHAWLRPPVAEITPDTKALLALIA